jgi:hypothetical protein
MPSWLEEHKREYQERHVSTVDRYHVSSPQCLLADPRGGQMSQGRKVNRSIATMMVLRGIIVV